MDANGKAHISKAHPSDRVDRLAQTVQRAQGNPVFQLVFADLHRRINQGEWKAGERLPSITQLANDLQASTGSVREALRSLQSLGLVHITHGRGVFVAEEHTFTDPASASEDASNTSLLLLAEVRRVVEPELAALAAERGSELQLSEIEQVARNMEALPQAGLVFTTLDHHFHCCIAQAAHNPILSRMVEHSIALSLEQHAIPSLAEGMAARTVHYHLLIADALSKHHAAQARLLMLAHMQDVFSGVE